jgi:hypothetical protein
MVPVAVENQKIWNIPSLASLASHGEEKEKGKEGVAG